MYRGPRSRSSDVPIRIKTGPGGLSVWTHVVCATGEKGHPQVNSGSDLTEPTPLFCMSGFSYFVVLF